MTSTSTDRSSTPPATRPRTATATVAVAAALTALLAGCTAPSEQDGTESPQSARHSDDSDQRAGHHGATQSPRDGTQHGAGHGGSASRTGSVRGAAPLREGERRLSVTMPEPYRPAAPTADGIDDYRCFLLDPELAEDVLVTGTDVSPGDPSMVHHVILSQVPPEQVEAARSVDRSTTEQGWTCFGGTGLAGGGSQTASWLAAWTPGSDESLFRDGYAVPLEAGSHLVMQVHYSLLGGGGQDVTAAELRVTDGGADLEPVSTQLLTAPVELPCRDEYADGPLCDRTAALDDVRDRFGEASGSMAEWLRQRCSAAPHPVQSCTTTFAAPGTIIGVAGHMHLLGRAIRVEVAPGTPRSRTILDIPTWNFDDQGAVPIEPVEVRAGDRVTVTCEHDQALRDRLPAFEGEPDRYVLWGEGTTDEMCASFLQIAY